ncbi:MAG: LON peptidase substrate-binding domain-containing protein [Alphaproteobacteria bacterium]
MMKPLPKTGDNPAMTDPDQTDLTSDLPQTLPIFPLSGFLIFPGDETQLNIFEPRYLAMVEDALAGDKMIGMIQPHADDNEGKGRVYDIGCAVTIDEAQSTPDGRLLIWIRGISRFKVVEELESMRGYRRVQTCWKTYPADPELARKAEDPSDDGVSRDGFVDALDKYADAKGMELNRDALHAAPLRRVVHAVAMASDLSVAEKQAILEAETLASQTDLIQAMLEMAVLGRHGDDGKPTGLA